MFDGLYQVLDMKDRQNWKHLRSIGEAQRKKREFENKVKAAYHHGRMDYLAGIPCDPRTPLRVYRDLNDEQKKVVTKSYRDGWDDQKSLTPLVAEGISA